MQKHEAKRNALDALSSLYELVPIADKEQRAAIKQAHALIVGKVI